MPRRRPKEVLDRTRGHKRPLGSKLLSKDAAPANKLILTAGLTQLPQLGPIKIILPGILPQFIQPQQFVQPQPPSLQEIWDTFLEQLGAYIEDKWAKGSSDSYIMFKAGYFLNSAQDLPPWLRNVGGFMVIGGVFGGVADLKKTMDQRPLRLG